VGVYSVPLRCNATRSLVSACLSHGLPALNLVRFGSGLECARLITGVAMPSAGI
jgi:hypothetical protein